MSFHACYVACPLDLCLDKHRFDAGWVRTVHNFKVDDTDLYRDLYKFKVTTTLYKIKVTIIGTES